MSAASASRGVSLGPAAALFVGLAVGAIDDAVGAADGLGLLRQLGLVLFTYTVGLASGPTFVAGLRRGGALAVAVTTALVASLAGLCALVAWALDLSAADRAGLFAGSTTNTPSLQAAAEAVTDGDPVVAYSLAYPAAIASMIAILTLLLGRRLRLPTRLEPPPPAASVEQLINWTVNVTTPGLPLIGDLRVRYPGPRVQPCRARRRGDDRDDEPQPRTGRRGGRDRSEAGRRGVLQRRREPQRSPPPARSLDVRLPPDPRLGPSSRRRADRRPRSAGSIRRDGDAGPARRRRPAVPRRRRPPARRPGARGRAVDRHRRRGPARSATPNVDCRRSTRSGSRSVSPPGSCSASWTCRCPAAARSSSDRAADRWSSGCASARSRAPARSRGRSQGPPTSSCASSGSSSSSPARDWDRAPRSPTPSAPVLGSSCWPPAPSSRRSSPA